MQASAPPRPMPASAPSRAAPPPSIARWMAGAFAAEAVAAALVLAAFGAGERGTDDALLLTGRISFLLFWPAYAGGALANLFGPRCVPLKRRAREFGLAFAAGHLVHVGLVAWLCWIGAAPPASSFVFFGVALVCLYLLALASLERVRAALGPVGWRVLRVGGMNYIAYAFAADFLRFDHITGLKSLIAYLPFAALSLLGPALVLAAALRRFGVRRREVLTMQ